MNNKIKLGLLFICVLVFGFSAYKLISYYSESNKAKNIYDDLYNQYNTSETLPQEETMTIPYEETIIVETSVNSDGEEIQIPRIRFKDKKTLELIDELPTDIKAKEVSNPNTINVKDLMLKYPDVKGWIWGQGGHVNYPLTQGKDNDYYLTHLVDGTYNTAGTIIIDCNNNFPDDNIIWIYGHKRKDLTMFGKFYNYDSYSYYLNNPCFYIYTDEKTYRLDIVGTIWATPLEHYVLGYRNEQEFETFYNYVKSRSPYIGTPLQYGDTIVVLQCCAWHVESGRYRIVCRLTEES